MGVNIAVTVAVPPATMVTREPLIEATAESEVVYEKVPPIATARVGAVKVNWLAPKVFDSDGKLESVTDHWA